MPEKSERNSAVGGLVACEICKDVISDAKDTELNLRVSYMMRSELRLQNLYNRFRVSKGLPAVEFESVHLLPTRDVKVNMCFVCHFDAFADIHDEYQTIKE